MVEHVEVQPKEVRWWNFGKLVELCEGSGLVKFGIMSELEEGWSSLNFPQKSWTIVDLVWNILNILEKVEDIEWI
jgi:hypothetical protein